MSAWLSTRSAESRPGARARRDPDARADDDVLARAGDRLRRDRGDDPVGDDLGVLELDLLEHDRELVASDPADRVLGTNARRDALRDLDEHRVAGGVPEPVVDVLEVVEIEVQHGDRARCPPARPVLEALEQQRPVRKAGEWVVERPVRQLLLEPAAVGDLLEVAADLHRLAVVDRPRRPPRRRPRARSRPGGRCGTRRDTGCRSRRDRRGPRSTRSRSSG